MSGAATLSTNPGRQKHSYATDPDNPIITMLMPDNRYMLLTYTTSRHVVLYFLTQSMSQNHAADAQSL